MGVVFFPSLPFMGVMLFPSFVLGNASGEGSGSLALLSLFFFLLIFSFFSFLPFFLPQLSHLLIFFFFLSLSSVPTPFFFFSSYHTPFFLFSLSHSSFPFPSFMSSSHSVFLLCPLFFFFFLRGLLVLSAYQDVIEDTTDCNQMRFI